MWNSPTGPRIRLAVVAAAVSLGAVAALPSAASAAVATKCDASALQLSLLGGAPINPIHANGGGAVCADSDGTLLQLPLLIADVQAVEAHTRLTAAKQAVSTARIAGARVGVGPVVDRLTGPLLTGPNSIVPQLDNLLAGLLTPVNGLLSPLNNLLGGLVPVGGFDNSAVLTSVTGQLPAALVAALPNILTARVIGAQAQTTCVTGAVPKLSGSSQIADLQVLGTTIDPNGAANRVLSIDTAHLNLGQIVSVNDILKGIRLRPEGITGGLITALAGWSGSSMSLYDIVYGNNGGLLGAVNGVLTGAGLPTVTGIVGTLTTTVIQPALDGVQVNLPPGLLHAVVTPNAQTVVNGTLTQQAVTLSVSALSQPILSGVLAEARVSAGSAKCANNGDDGDGGQDGRGVIKDPKKYSSPEAEVVLQCLKGAPATLIDVYGDRGRTYIHGVAQRKFVGKTATIYLRHGKKKVGKAKINAKGLFTTRVALPPSSIRMTNKARYYAVVGGKKTRALKFSRRMLITKITSKGRRVTLAGRVIPPLDLRPKTIEIRQRVTCKSYRKVATVKLSRTGHFRTTIQAPKGGGAVVYRAQTRVPKVLSSAKRYPTYTLPRVIGTDL